MKHVRPSFLAVVAVLSMTVPASAQEPQSTQKDGADAKEAVEMMTSALRQMASAQEIFYSKNMRYAGEVDVLAAYEPVPGVTVRLVTIHQQFQGYAAEATHPALEGGNCVIFIGAEGTPEIVTRRERKSNGMGRVACDSAT